jgi:hypothetical protein
LGIVELLAEPSNMHVNGPGRHVAVVLPHDLEYLFARNHSVAVVQQITQKLQFFGCKTDGLATP